MTNAKRLLWPDLIKAVAIFLVIYIHQFRGISHPEGFDYVYVSFFSLAPLSVPLFVMVSGALLLNKKEPTSIFLAKRIKKLFIAWIFWVIIYTLFDIWNNTASCSSVFMCAKLIAKAFLTRLWFLPLIFSMYLLTPLLNKLLKKISFWHIIFLIIWFVVVSLVPFLKEMLHRGILMPLPIPIQYIGYYMLGFILLQIKKLPPVGTLIFFFLISLILSSTFAVYSTLQNHGKLLTPSFSFLSPTTALSCLFLFLLLYKLATERVALFSQKTKQFIHSIGKTAFGIYLIHQLLGFFLYELFFKYTLDAMTIHELYLFATVIKTLCLFFLSYITVLALQKIPYGKYFVP